jgi:hypothetical protein
MSPSATQETVEVPVPVQVKELKNDATEQVTIQEPEDDAAVKEPTTSTSQPEEDKPEQVKPEEVKPAAEEASALKNEEPQLLTNHREPLKLSGALDHIKYFETTPAIGREFENVDLVELLRAENSDELLRDLAITSKSLLQSEAKVVANDDDVSLATWCRLLPQAGQCNR